MSLEEFARELEGRVRLALDKETGVQLHELLRNNGTRRLALTIRAEESAAAPVIYLEEYYARFRLGENLDTLTEEILRFGQSCRAIPEEAGELTSWRKIRERLGFRLINRGKNRHLLETMPHRRFLDLAVTYLVFLDSADGAERTIAVTEAYRSVLGVTEEQLYLQAMANQPRLQRGMVKPIAEMVRELMHRKQDDGRSESETLESLLLPGCDPEELPMAVITNSRRYLGAGAIFYPNLLSGTAKLLGADRIYLLPSSIHEMIAVPAGGGLNPSGLLTAIHEINETAVPPEERLSDSLYLYDRREEKFRKLS